MDIMTRGFDHFNRAFTFVEPPSGSNTSPREFSEREVAYFAPVSAANLKASSWLAMDKVEKSYGPRIFLEEKTGDVVIEAGHGIRFVGLDSRGDVADYKSFLDDGNPPMRLSFSQEEIARRVGRDRVRIRVVDDAGLGEEADLNRLTGAGGFVRAWRFAGITKSWTNQSQFVGMSKDDLKAIEDSASSAPLVRTRDSFVDFLPRFKKKQTFVVAYAVRTIIADKPRKVKFITGSDDGLRVWVNGKKVIETTLLRAAEPDQDSTVVDLEAGKNVVVAEVSQADGGWGLYFRIEDEDGKKLQLTDEGKLVSLE